MVRLPPRESFGLEIPAEMRERVRERDGGFCRVCGEFAGDRAVLHHIVYGGPEVGMGGRRWHAAGNLVTLTNGCHSLVHSNQRLWQPLLLAVIERPGVTALQLRRWANQVRR